MYADVKAMRLYNDFIRAERALNSKLESNMTLEDLEEVIHLQEEVQAKYFLFTDYAEQFK
ncbi:MAG: hypothetical protein ACRCXT_14415 [Paraclostridium sp.]